MKRLYSQVLVEYSNETADTKKKKPRLKQECDTIEETIQLNSLPLFEKYNAPSKYKIQAAVKHQFKPYLDKTHHMPYEVKYILKFACMYEQFDLAKQFIEKYAILANHSLAVCPDHMCFNCAIIQGLVYAPCDTASWDSLFIIQFAALGGNHCKIENIVSNTVPDVHSPEYVLFLKRIMIQGNVDLGKRLIRDYRPSERECAKILHYAYKSCKTLVPFIVQEYGTEKCQLPLACITGDLDAVKDLSAQCCQEDLLEYAFKLAYIYKHESILYQLLEFIDMEGKFQYYVYAIRWGHLTVARRVIATYHEPCMIEFMRIAIQFNCKEIIFELQQHVSREEVFKIACSEGNNDLIRDLLYSTHNWTPCQEVLKEGILSAQWNDNLSLLKTLYHHRTLDILPTTTRHAFDCAIWYKDLSTCKFLVKFLVRDTNDQDCIDTSVNLCKHEDMYENLCFYLLHTNLDLCAIIDRLVYSDKYSDSIARPKALDMLLKKVKHYKVNDALKHCVRDVVFDYYCIRALIENGASNLNECLHLFLQGQQWNLGCHLPACTRVDDLTAKDIYRLVLECFLKYGANDYALFVSTIMTAPTHMKWQQEYFFTLVNAAQEVCYSRRDDSTFSKYLQEWVQNIGRTRDKAIIQWFIKRQDTSKNEMFRSGIECENHVLLQELLGGGYNYHTRRDKILEILCGNELCQNERTRTESILNNWNTIGSWLQDDTSLKNHLLLLAARNNLELVMERVLESGATNILEALNQTCSSDSAIVRKMILSLDKETREEVFLDACCNKKHTHQQLALCLYRVEPLLLITHFPTVYPCILEHFYLPWQNLMLNNESLVLSLCDYRTAGTVFDLACKYKDKTMLFNLGRWNKITRVEACKRNNGFITEDLLLKWFQ